MTGMMVGLVLTTLMRVALSAEPDTGYQAALDQANTALNEALNGRGSCPGVGLAVTCGDGKCEPDKGETPESCPVDCVPPLIKSYNDQTLCRGITRVYQPGTIEEVQAIVRQAAADGQHVRVVGRLHSANEQLCTTGVVLSTEKLNHVLGLETFNGVETVVTEPGATLYELGEWLHARDRSLGYALIGFRGVSVAGAAATGSHGSSALHSNIISSAVESVWLVGPTGELREYSALSTDPMTWKALRANLGMMGVIVRLRLRVQPQFNLKVKVSFEPDKRLFEHGGAFSLVKDCDYGLINWFPGTRRIMRSCGVVTREAAQPGANNRLLDPAVPDFLVKPFKKVLQYGACYNALGCLVENARALLLPLMPPFEANDPSGHPSGRTELVGPSHRMMTSVLSQYQKGLTQMDWEVAVPYQNAQAALEAVREHVHRNKVCLPLVGIFLRFAPSEDTTLLAHTVSQGEFHRDEPAMFIEMPVYLPHAFPEERRKSYDRPFEDFARMMIEKFGARPHWAKNRDWALELARDRDEYGPNYEAFRSVVARLDPTGLFMNDWGRKLGLSSFDPLEELLGEARPGCR